MVDGRLTHDANPRRNPTVEEQALARVHRLGQQKEVTTVRFFVRDTFEEVSNVFVRRTVSTDGETRERIPLIRNSYVSAGVGSPAIEKETRRGPSSAEEGRQ